MFKRLLKPPTRSFFLFGVRGSGKSTWVRDALPNSTYIDLLDEVRYLEYLANPELFRETIQADETTDWVIVDEVQRIPNLLSEVHLHIESTKLKFALLGSSNRRLKTSSSNLLAGRASQRFMYPFTPEELGTQFDLEEVLRFGSIPLIRAEEDKVDALKSYVNLYLKEEIKAEALVRNLAGFARFLPIAALFHGQTINVSAIARDSDVSTSTVKGFVEVLEDTFIASRLVGFQPKLRVKERSHPKFYLIDPGLVRTLKHQSGSISNEERGALFEGLVYVLLCTYRDTRNLFDSIHYWAPLKSQTEVDFLLERGGERIAIEVKSGSNYNKKMLFGLKAIGELTGVVRRILIYGGNGKFRTDDGIDIWSFSHFLEALAQDSLWP